MKNKYEIIEDDVIIYLIDRKNNIRKTIVDIRDFDKVNKYHGTFWAHYGKKAKSYYCRITIYQGMKNGKPRYKVEYLHRILLNVKSTRIRVDHKDHNTLNNRRLNLRKSTAVTNSTHRSRLNQNNNSGYRNVSWVRGFWRVQLQIDGKNHLFVEKFEDVDKAGIFADQMRQKYYGEFAGT